ncbi:MAG: exo-beta-N-acetylmuramidase NamZ family protein [Luteitalea sp.]
MPVTLGLTRLLASGRLDGARIGLVTNPSSVDARLIHAVEQVTATPGVTLAALFGPQHGFHSTLQDNMIETPHAEDRQRRVPVYSLYSETREPTDAMLEGLDALVIDLQDVGTRVYTFSYTMAYCLKAAARRGLPVIVCDRPNPIGGRVVEGPMLQPGFESFVGLFPIALRHGLTIGELASLFNVQFGLDAALEVIAMEGWQRGARWDQTGLPWVMPSPNLPTLDSASVYPGMVLFEGTLLSEGRGTTRPFELVGAPGVDAERLAAAVNALALPGVAFRPAYFEPTFQKHARITCGGCQVHVTDRELFRPVDAAIALLCAFRDALPDRRLPWRPPPYEYEHDKMPIDILAGSDGLRRAVDAGASPLEISVTCRLDATSFDGLRTPCLLY